MYRYGTVSSASSENRPCPLEEHNSNTARAVYCSRCRRVEYLCSMRAVVQSQGSTHCTRPRLATSHVCAADSGCFTKYYFALYDGTNLPASLHISTCHAVTCGWPSLARMALHSAWRAAHRATAPHATRGSDMSHGEAKGFMTPVGPAAMIRTTYVLEPRAHRTLCPYQNRAASCATRGQHQLHLPLA